MSSTRQNEIDSLNEELINSFSIEELEKRLEMEEPVCGILWEMMDCA